MTTPDHSESSSSSSSTSNDSIGSDSPETLSRRLLEQLIDISELDDSINESSCPDFLAKYRSGSVDYPNPLARPHSRLRAKFGLNPNPNPNPTDQPLKSCLRKSSPSPPKDDSPVQYDVYVTSPTISTEDRYKRAEDIAKADIYNWPGMERATKDFTVVQFFVELQTEHYLTDAPQSKPIAVAVPSLMVQDILTFIATHPRARGTPLESLQTDYKLPKEAVSMLTQKEIAEAKRLADSEEMEPERIPRTPNTDPEKSFDDNAQPNATANDISPTPQGRNGKGAQEGQLQVANDPEAVTEVLTAQVKDFQPRDDQKSGAKKRPKLAKKPPNVYDNNGMLDLSALKEPPQNEASNEGWQCSADSQNEDPHLSKKRLSATSKLKSDKFGNRPNTSIQASQQIHSTNETNMPTESNVQQPVTPRPSGWSFANFLPSSRMVAQFMPSLGFRTNHNDTTASSIPQNQDYPVGPPAPMTEPRPKTVMNIPSVSPKESNTLRALQRYRKSFGKAQLHTSGEREMIKKQKEEITRLKKQLEAARERNPAPLLRNARRKAAEQAAREAEETAMKQAQEEAEKEAQKAGSKRKRVSLDVIPNPPGGGFGMDLDYFGQDSDEDTTILDTDQNASEPPANSNKKARLETSPNTAIVGDPHQATPYTGTLFTMPGMQNDNPTVHGNTFVAQDMNERSPSEADNTPPRTTPVGPTMRFTVPSPSDSDSDYEGESLVEDPSPTPKSQQKSLDIGPTSPEQSSIIEWDDWCVYDDPDYIPRDSAAQYLMSGGLLVDDYENLGYRDSAPTAQDENIALALGCFPIEDEPYPPVNISRVEPQNNAFSASAALDRARQTALKHQPLQPSRLREASRLSTSTTASEPVVEKPQTTNGDFASFEHYQQLVPGHVKDSIAMDWERTEEGAVKATDKQFPQDFEKWSVPSAGNASRRVSFESAIEQSNDSAAIDPAVWKNIGKKWTEGYGDMTAGQDFSSTFAPWVDAQEAAAARFEASLTSSPDDEAWNDFDEELEKFLAADKSAQPLSTAV